ncbi:MAG: YigZ family protein [Firmicutes bacterium]|nr:YigZ family protein [Bacillota bacterium]
MADYLTAAKAARTEQTIERSRFITSASPVTSREEAEAFFAEIRREFRDATHNVPAFVIGDKMQLQWASDDGEPQGTSGAPIVRLITGRGITNVAIVVTRYFGGIKLGTGGLVRAYTSSAAQCLDACGTANHETAYSAAVKLSYPAFEKLKRAVLPAGTELGETEYSERVRVELVYDGRERGNLMKLISDISMGDFEQEPEKETERVVLVP